MSESNYWVLADKVKRRLFNKLREETQKINYLHYKRYKKSLERIYDILLNEWYKIQHEYKDKDGFNASRLEGYLLETLFYYACLKTEASIFDVELVEMGEATSSESPPGLKLHHYMI